MAKTFEQQINDFALNVDKANERVMKGVTIKLFGAIIKASPVDTGRFRANWFLTQRAPSVRVTNSIDKSGQKATQRVENGVLSAQNYNRFILTNNLPYSEVIEFGRYPKNPKKGSKVSKKGEKPARYEKLSSGGFSRQAPEGVVRVNVVRFETLLEERAQKEGYGRI